MDTSTRQTSDMAQNVELDAVALHGGKRSLAP